MSLGKCRMGKCRVTVMHVLHVNFQIYFFFRLSPGQALRRPLLAFFESEIPTFFPSSNGGEESLVRVESVLNWARKMVDRDEIEDIGKETLTRVSAYRARGFCRFVRLQSTHFLH
jgi:hypothetical protein